MKLVKEQNKPIKNNEVSDKEAEEAYIKILKWITEGEGWYMRTMEVKS